MSPGGQPQTENAAASLLPVVGKKMKPLIEMLRVFSRQHETITLSGATGSGKSKLAHWCHAQSRRFDKPFCTVDLNTVPEDMHTAELFGWKKGAFTSSVNDGVGLVTLANGGTLFLDEVDKLSMKAQAGLLRFLETKLFRPLGDHKQDRFADVRILVGTAADLKSEVKAGRFREDLFYRIHVLPFRVPTLAERRDEIPDWVRFMLKRRTKESHHSLEIHIQTAAIDILVRFSWPGNLRQLDNVLRRAFAMALIGHEHDLILNIDVSHIEQALTFESGTDVQPTQELESYLQNAATVFVEHAMKARNGGRFLDLTLTQGFRGFVLKEAVQRTGGEREAMLLFGREKAVQDRNHTKLIKLELDRMNELKAEFQF